MIFMNEYDVAEVRRHVDAAETPNLAQGAWVLGNLIDWTNRNSDGWAYWPKPGRSAQRLITLLHERDYAIMFGHDRSGTPLVDVSDAELTAAFAPIKSFLTRQGASTGCPDAQAEVFAV